MTATRDREETLARFAEIFAELTPEKIDALEPLLSEDIRFVDPFQEIRGRDAYLELYRKMYRQLADPVFVIDDTAFGRDGYIRWTMRFRFKRRPKVWEVVGMSQFVFDADGRISQHIDHWDSGTQVYLHVPGLGFLIERIRRRAAH